MIKKCLWSSVAIAGIIGLSSVGGWAYSKLNTSRSVVADNRIKLTDFKSADQDAISRGEYVMRTADCVACHSGPEGVFSGGHAFDTPFGTILSSNITPDTETGIGGMTERDFFNAVRNGQGSKGFVYPAMPYTAYAKLSDDDMRDLWAYMSTIKPVHNVIDESAGLSFPFNVRLLMAGWNMLFFDNSAFVATAVASEQLKRGQYLVDGGTHCSVCHTPRNILGAEISSQYLQGGNLGVWFAPDLTSNPSVGLGQTSAQDIVEYLKTGGNDKSIATGPMAEAIEHSFQYLKDEDLEAIAAYLKSIPASEKMVSEKINVDDPTRVRGALNYEVNCSACHGVRGEGMGNMVPAFAGNHALQSDDATNQIHVMLKGGRAAATHYKLTGAGMPSFAWKMGDRQIAETLDYIRNAWGNSAKHVSIEEIARLRHALEAAQKLPVN